MSLCEIRDKSFDEKQFADVLEHLDAYVLAQMLADLDMRYVITSGGQNYMGNIHSVIVFSRFLQKGFKLDLYENQSLRVKGVFHVQVDLDIYIDAFLKSKLKEMGFSFDSKLWTKTGKRSYAVKMVNRMQFLEIMDIFKDQLP